MDELCEFVDGFQKFAKKKEEFEAGFAKTSTIEQDFIFNKIEMTITYCKTKEVDKAKQLLEELFQTKVLKDACEKSPEIFKFRNSVGTLKAENIKDTIPEIRKLGEYFRKEVTIGELVASSCILAAASILLYDFWLTVFSVKKLAKKVETIGEKVSEFKEKVHEFEEEVKNYGRNMNLNQLKISIEKGNDLIGDYKDLLEQIQMLKIEVNNKIINLRDIEQNVLMGAVATGISSIQTVFNAYDNRSGVKRDLQIVTGIAQGIASLGLFQAKNMGTDKEVAQVMKMLEQLKEHENILNAAKKKLDRAMLLLDTDE